MSKFLIVYAHPEPASFNGRLLAHAVSTLEAQGHEVRVSDLYAMRFNPVASGDDFLSRRFEQQLYYDREQKHSAARASFSADIADEVAKLAWCDTLILQFPLWWFSVPAIMKGWIDRVLVNGLAYGAGKRFETGGLKGKRAMLALSTGCDSAMVEPDGMLGDLHVNLWHLHAGTFAYTGCTVMPPFCAWSIQYVDDQTRESYLDAYAAHLGTLDQQEPLFFHPQSDSENFRLKPGVVPRTVGQRRVG